MSNLQKAIDLANEKHADQYDKLGEAYVEHLRRVAQRLRTDTEKTVAWLHDILEDTDMTAGDLAAAGFPDEVVEAVVALTKREGETYEDFIRRAAVHPVAGRVKAADLADNMDEDRLRQLPRDLADGLRTKYSSARNLLPAL